MTGSGKKGIATGHMNSWNSESPRPMNRLLKLLVICLCFVICGAGAIFMPVDSAPINPERPNAMPVRNHEPARRIWLQV
jgi:hypothetical protein